MMNERMYVFIDCTYWYRIAHTDITFCVNIRNVFMAICSVVLYCIFIDCTILQKYTHTKTQIRDKNTKAS